MITTDLPKEKVLTLYEQLKLVDSDGFDIGDDTFDRGNYFACPMSWEKCDDDYDRCMLLFALNIDVVKYQPSWYTICKVTEFIEANREAFDKFMNEENREGLRPCDCEYSLTSDDDEYYDIYISTFECLINGLYSQEDYKKLFEYLTAK